MLTGTPGQFLYKPDFTLGMDNYNDINDFTNEQSLFFYGVYVQPPQIIEYNI